MVYTVSRVASTTWFTVYTMLHLFVWLRPTEVCNYRAFPVQTWQLWQSVSVSDVQFIIVWLVPHYSHSTFLKTLLGGCGDILWIRVTYLTLAVQLPYENESLRLLLLWIMKTNLFMKTVLLGSLWILLYGAQSHQHMFRRTFRQTVELIHDSYACTSSASVISWKQVGKHDLCNTFSVFSEMWIVWVRLLTQKYMSHSETQQCF